MMYDDDLLPLVDDYFRSGAAQKDMEVLQMEQGTPIYWLYTPRGGYGWTERVIALVVKSSKSRVGIAVLKADHETWVPKWVRPENIKLREV